MALHGWIKTLRGHLLLATLAVFIAACGSSGDDGGNGSPGGGGGPVVVPPELIGTGVEIDLAYAKPVIQNTGQTFEITGGLKKAPPADSVVEHNWTVLSQPEGANLTLAKTITPDQKQSTVTFTPTVAGPYLLEIEINEQGKLGKSAIILAEVVDPAEFDLANCGAVANSAIGSPDYYHYMLCFHSQKPSQCSNCHGTIDTEFNNHPVPGKPPGHIDTTNNCQSCHSVYGFKRVRSPSMPHEVRKTDHSQVLGECASCHDGISAIAKGPSHPQTGDICDDCHDQNTTFLPSAYNHSGITSGCAGCHDGFLAKGKIDAPKQHVATNLDCSSCHPSTTTFIGAADFHNTFVGGCITCHDGNPTIGQPAYHPFTLTDATLFECDDCHTVHTFNVSNFNHRSVLDTTKITCITCHDGNHTAHTAPNTFGQKDNANHTHAAGEDNCQNCHKADALDFTTAFVDHSGPEVTPYLNDCVFCHNGTNAVGVTQNHVPLAWFTDAANITASNPTGEPNCLVCHEAGGSFANGTFDHNVYLPKIPSKVCSSCHDDTISVGQSVGHIPTGNAECDQCHSTTTFTGAWIDHANLPIPGERCDGCHSDGHGVTSLPVGHLPLADAGTKQGELKTDCGACHGVPTTNNPLDMTFRTATFVHKANDYENGCLTCHDGTFTSQNALAKPRTTHIPTVDNCLSCHDPLSTSFTDGNYVHPSLGLQNGAATTPYGCEGCHKAQFTTDSNGTTTPHILSKEGTTPPHIPTTQDCYFCHTDPGGAWTANFKHRGITDNCESCHDGLHHHTINGATAILGKIDAPTTHPEPASGTDNVCSHCHLYPTDLHPEYTWASTAQYNHDLFNPQTDKCENCHNATYAQSVAALDKNGNVVVEYKSATHQVYPASWDCNACHAPGATFVPATFDHANVDATVRCDSCHDGSTATGTKDKPVGTHINILKTNPVTGKAYDCRDCHNTTAFAGAKFDHSNLPANQVCTECHDGSTAPGKPIYHVITSDDCKVCHQTTGWIPGLFAHTATQINGQRCDSCHGQTVTDNGVDYTIATGKDAAVNHVVTSQDCGACHKTTAWIPASFDHASVTTSTLCESCHNGSDATGKPGNHFPTTRDCRDCHDFNAGSFAGAKYDHKEATSTVITTPKTSSKEGNCLTCHGDSKSYVGTPGKSNGHINTVNYVSLSTNLTFKSGDVQCDVCHLKTSWSPKANSFDHANFQFRYPGNHRNNPVCSFCHSTGTKFKLNPDVWRFNGPNPELNGSCAGCHKNNFSSNGNHIGGRSGTVQQNKDCSGGGSGCHRVNGGGFG